MTKLQFSVILWIVGAAVVASIFGTSLTWAFIVNPMLAYDWSGLVPNISPMEWLQWITF